MYSSNELQRVRSLKFHRNEGTFDRFIRIGSWLSNTFYPNICLDEVNVSIPQYCGNSLHNTFEVDSINRRLHVNIKYYEKFSADPTILCML